MASNFFVLFLVTVLFFETDCFTPWSWGKFSDFETLSQQDKQVKDCIDGECLQAWKCPENETALEEPTTCSKNNGGPWVCCIKLSKNKSMIFNEKPKITTPIFIERLIDRTNDSDSINSSETPDWTRVAINDEPSKEENSSYSVIFNEKPKITTPFFIEHLIDRTNDSYSTNSSTTPDWISVAINEELSKKENSSSQKIMVEYKENANIVNWGKSRVHSPKYSHGEDSRDGVAFRKVHKPYVWSKGSTSNPSNRITENKWLHHVSPELRNKYPPETGYETDSEYSWDYDHNHHYTKKTTRNWIVKTTPYSRWSSTKSSWNSDRTSSKSTNNWESKRTPSSWVKPTSGTSYQVTNSRSTTKASAIHSWTKSTKSVYDWNHSPNSYGSTKTPEVSTSPKPRTKSTTQSWRWTTSFQKINKTLSTINMWAKPTKDPWSWEPTKDPWIWDSSSKSEKKSTRINPNTPTTRKATTNKHTRVSSTTKSLPRISAAYTSKQTVNNRLTTPKLSSTRSTISTRKPSFENIEKSRSSPRTPSAITRSTTKRYTRTTPLPDVNSQRCGIRVTREAPRRGKRQLASDEFVTHRGVSGRGKSRTPFQRIVGGTEVEPFSWPWVAALYRVSESGGNRFLSAGSLINRNFVLTAAHVFTPDDLRSASFVVMLGTHTAKEAVAEYMVMNVLRHPNYEQRYYYHDIALLRLERPVQLNEYVMPVCLPSPSLPLVKDEDLEGKQVTVMGWGDESYGGKTSRVLQEASFPIVPRKSCNESYFQVASNRFPRGITSNMLCAGDPNGGKDACQGDSGGPLTTVKNGRHTQVGIVSFGYKCGDKEYPGVYTKVAPYLSWIAENARCDDYNDYSYYY